MKNYILSVLAYYPCVAFAAPSVLEADTSPTITLCIDVNFGNCSAIPIVADTCTNFTGGLSIYNQLVSSSQIPPGFVCTFFRNSNCLSSGTADAVVLQGGNYPDFTQLPGDGTVTDFNDSTSSISCTPV